MSSGFHKAPLGRQGNAGTEGERSVSSGGLGRGPATVPSRGPDEGGHRPTPGHEPHDGAGLCGLQNVTNLGIGDSIAYEAIPNAKLDADYMGLPLGAVLHTGFELDGVAWGLVEWCTPGHSSE